MGPNVQDDAMSDEIEFNRLTDDKPEDKPEDFGSTKTTEMSKAGTSSKSGKSDEVEESGMKLLQDLATKQAFD